MGSAADASYGSHRSMVEDMQRMLDDTSFSGIVFVCGEQEEEVPALRMLVAARSPALECMLLRAGMAESKLTRIPLPEMEGPTMRICMEFFYTDTVKDSSWLSIEFSMKVIAAAKFFLVEKLEQLAISHLVSSTAWIDDIDENQYLDLAGPLLVEMGRVLTLGVDLYRDHPSVPMHSLLQRFGHCIGLGSECHFECHKHLSEEALVHLLKSLDPLRDRSLWEYSLFHHVICWCASRLVLGSDDPSTEEEVVQNTLSHFFPWYEEDIHRSPSMSTALSHDASMLRIIKLLVEPVASCLNRVPVNFANIPPTILCKIIEPLDIIPSSTLLTAYRLQALNRSDLRWDHSGHYENYKISGKDLTVISCKSDVFEGFARCSICAGLSSVMISGWEIVILKPCENLRIGFCLGKPFIPKEDYDTYLLGANEWSWALSSEGFLHHNSRRRKAPFSTFHGLKGERVGVHLDIHQKSCSFSINGKDAGVAWKDLPLKEQVYPAISMQKPGKVRVQMVLEDWMVNPDKVLKAYSETNHKMQHG